MNIDAKVLKKALENQIQHHIRKILYYEQASFISGMQK
jgi:hypothetical protein